MQRNDKAPRFRDMEKGGPRIKGKRMLFFAPHTSESAATLPLISDLSEMLERKGVSCEAHAVVDMKARLLSMSAKLARIGFTEGELAKLDVMFRLKDAELRLGILTSLLQSEPSAALLEVHALDKDYMREDEFRYCDYFYRLPGTRAIFLKDYLAEYSIPVERGMELMGSKLGKRLMLAAGIIGLDVERYRLEQSLEFLEQQLHRISLMEIPAPSDTNDGRTRMTRFERAYGYSSSLKHTLTKKEVATIAEALSA